MSNRSWLWATAGAAILAAAYLGRPVLVAQAAPDQTPSPPRLVLFSGAPGSLATDLVVAEPGTEHAAKHVATLAHPPEAVVRGRVLSQAPLRVVAVADQLPSRDRSWASSLVLLEEGKLPRVLVDSVFHASRPMLTDGRVFVQRGEAGPERRAPDGQLLFRVDELRVEEVDPVSAQTRVVHSWSGYETHLAGSAGRELLVYRVGPGNADLVGVHVDTGAVRTIVGSWPPFARDFSVESTGQGLIAQQRSAEGVWVVVRVDLATGNTHSLATSQLDLVPFAWPDGRVMSNPQDRRGPLLDGKGGLIHSPGPGVLWVREAAPDRAWLGGLWMRSRELPQAVAVQVSDGRVVPAIHPPGERVEVVGLLGGAP